MTRRHFIAVLAAAACALPSIALGQAFPTKTVTLIVPYSPGGLPDTVARVIGQRLAEKWGHSVIVENKPGGNGVVAAQALAAKPADGYTLIVTDGTMFSVNPSLYPNLPYDPQKDFTYISLAATAPLFLAVHPSMPVNSFGEFVQLVKSNPGKYSYGSSGIGSIHHLTFESIKSALALDIVHVPYKGTGQSIPALVAGDVAGVWSAMPSIAGFAKEGKLKLIAVNSEKRSGLAPNLATVAETHIPGFNFAPIIGFVGPAGLPAALARKISADVADVVRDKSMEERLTTLGIEAVGSEPQAFASQIAADRERFAKAIKLADIKGQ
jgi:tripartite-type tricarboxylate transporter receptor subunit TctC